MWPSSFASLRQLALGLPTDGQSERDWIPGRDILPLFMLPNLEAIYIRGLAVADDEMEAIDASREYDELPTASSPVRHVCIEAAFRDCAEHVIANIIRACGALETLVLSSCDLRYNFDWIPQELVLRKSSVKTFLPCGDVSRLRGYCGSTYGDMWKELRSLEVLPMELDELAFQAGCLETQDKNALRDGVATTFERMPGNIGNPRVLVLHGNVDPITLGNGIEQSRELIGFIDEGLARLIFAQRNFAETEDGDRTLKALYLDKAVDTLLAHDLVETRAAAFPKTREVAEQLRISLHCEEGALDRFANETCRPIFGVGLAFDRLY